MPFRFCSLQKEAEEEQEEEEEEDGNKYRIK